MKLKTLLCLAAAGLLTQSSLPAQTPEAPSAATEQLQQLVARVREKIQAGKTNETDFAEDFKTFDTLIASEKGAKTEEAALIAFLKAQLYLEVIKDTDKGAALVRQIKVDYPATRIGTNVDRILDGIAKEAASEKIQASLAIGSVCPDFAETDLEGKPLSIASRKGKVVLLDFWATWCGPCRQELPNVIATYQKHHSEGFEIIGVSLDSERDKLDSFLKQEDGMTWPQYYDGQQWNNKLAVQYGVEAIPFALLIGPDGKIIGKDLRGDDLEAAVAKAVAAK
jgi:thiol-disulfide isomerase/thioredoxin